MTEVQYEKVIRETEQAYLIRFDEKVEHWIPKSQCCLPESNLIEIKDWLIEENELDGYVFI